MAYFSGIGLKVKSHKGFSSTNDHQGIEDIKHINVLIGKNNAGKSAYLEFLMKFITCAGEENNKAPFDFEVKVTRNWSDQMPKELNELFGAGIRRSFVSTPRIGLPQMPGPNAKMRLQWGENESHSQEHRTAIKDYKTAGLYHLENKSVFHIGAERDILPEVISHQIDMSPNGSGLTYFIYRLLNKQEFSDRNNKNVIIDGLNTILSPEITIDNINLRESPNGNLEIYLSEKDSPNEIPLRDMGSGIKTILFTLIALHHCKWKGVEKGLEAKDTFFFFEELENNLHPRVFRKLLTYIYDFSKTNDCPVFLTTHSPIAIDFFRSNSNAQIIHVYRDGLATKMETTTGLSGGFTLLDDLGVHASDLLQANCIIWLEGPSDRIYLNKWIQLKCEGKYTEGVHYQCVFYGGKLRAHLGIDAEDAFSSELVNLIKINRKVIFVADSDRREKEAPISTTLERLRSETTKSNGFFWVTEGREVENYLSTDLINEIYQTNHNMELGQFESIGDFLKRAGISEPLKKDSEKNSLKDKVAFAKMIASHYSIEHLERNPFNLKDSISELCKFIESANS